MIVLPILHKSFSKIPLERPDSSQQKGHNVPGSIVSSTVYFLPPRRAISTLTTILTNTDPSPVLISTLLSPILPPLYAILFYLDGVKTSDPQLKESLKSLLTTWGRVVSLQEVVSVLWTILDDQGGGWETDGEGEIRPVLWVLFNYLSGQVTDVESEINHHHLCLSSLRKIFVEQQERRTMVLTSTYSIFAQILFILCSS